MFIWQCAVEHLLLRVQTGNNVMLHAIIQCCSIVGVELSCKRLFGAIYTTHIMHTHIPYIHPTTHMPYIHSTTHIPYIHPYHTHTMQQHSMVDSIESIYA